MNSSHCPRCHKKMMEDFAKIPNNQNISIDTSRTVYRCKIPNFTTSSFGHPLVIIYDCKEGRMREMGHQDYLDKKDRGEL